MTFRPLRRGAISAIVLVALSLWAYGYIRSHPGVIDGFRSVSLLYIAVLSLLVVGIFATNGLYTRIILSAYGFHLSHRDSFLLAVATTASNYLLPARSGAGLRAIYLKRRMGFSFVDFLATLSGLYLIVLMVNGGLGLVSVALLAANGRPFDPWVSAGFLGAGLVAGGAMFIPVNLSVDATFPIGQLARVIDGWKMLRHHNSLLRKLATVVTCQSLLMFVQTTVAFRAFGLSVPVADALFFTSAKSLALLTAITPGALGIVEWLSVYMANNLTFSPQEAFMAQGLMRTITIATAFALGPVAVFALGIPLRRRETPETGGA